MSDPARRQTAIVACVDGQGRVLLVRQLAGPYAGAWLLPGGGVDPGETTEGALRREMREETGCEIEDVRHIATYEVDESTQDFRATVHLFVARAVGDPRPEPGGAIRWAFPREGGFHPALRRELADAGLRTEAEDALAQALGATNVTMRRVPAT